MEQESDSSGKKRSEVTRDRMTEPECWAEAPAGQKSFLVEVLHWHHFRSHRLKASWRHEETITWELLRALQLVPRLCLLDLLLQRIAGLGPEARAAAEPLTGVAGVEIVPYPSLGFTDSRKNSRSDIGFSLWGAPRVWLEVKTRPEPTGKIRRQLKEQRAALTAITSEGPTFVGSLLPYGMAPSFQPCLTWADVLVDLEKGVDVLTSVLPDPSLRRGYEDLLREMTDRIRTHPNRLAG